MKMVEVKIFNKNINNYFKIREEIKKTTKYNKWQDIYTELEDANNLINDLNNNLFKLASKKEGLYLKELTHIDVEFIGMKFSDITGQMKIINRDNDFPKRKIEKVNSEFQDVNEKCNQISENICSLFKVLDLNIE
jgi:hypothetical protein